MKKVITVLLAAVLLFAVVGCGQDGEKTANNKPADYAYSVVITIEQAQIKLFLNKSNTVTSFDLVNEAAKTNYANSQFNGLDFNSAVESLTITQATNGTIKRGSKIDVNLAEAKDSSINYTEILESAKSKIEGMLTQKGIEADLTVSSAIPTSSAPVNPSSAPASALPSAVSASASPSAVPTKAPTKAPTNAPTPAPTAVPATVNDIYGTYTYGYKSGDGKTGSMITLKIAKAESTFSWGLQFGPAVKDIIDIEGPVDQEYIFTVDGTEYTPRAGDGNDAKITAITTSSITLETGDVISFTFDKSKKTLVITDGPKNNGILHEKMLNTTFNKK